MNSPSANLVLHIIDVISIMRIISSQKMPMFLDYIARDAKTIEKINLRTLQLTSAKYTSRCIDTYWFNIIYEYARSIPNSQEIS